MKRTLFLISIVVILSSATYAGGLLTKTSQSTQFVRMASRNASLQIDAVYFNPAGLTELDDGWHFGLYNQTIFRNKTVNCGYPLLNESNYISKTTEPFSPSAFAVFKTANLAFSLGFGLNAGDGSVNFKNGLPTFEIPISRAVPELEGLNSYGYDITAYDLENSLSGTSSYMGIQAGVSYKVIKGLSVFGGVRFLSGKSTIDGYIRNIQLEVNGNYEDAPDFLNQAGSQLIAKATSYSGSANTVQQLITAGAGNYTIAQVQTAGYITSAQRATLESGLASLGFSQVQIAAMNCNQVRSNFVTGATNYNQQGTKALVMAVYTQDREFVTEEKGTGMTPFFGINYSPSGNLNIALKYEHKTKIVPIEANENDEPELISSIPGFLAVGIGYKPISRLETQISFNLYFDKDVDWGINPRESVAHNRDTFRAIERNSFELALGLQYNISDRFAVSAGAVTFQPGVNNSYQSDLSYINQSVTTGAGIQWKLTDQITLDAGIMYSFCKSQESRYFDVKLQEYNNKYPSEYSGLEFVHGEYSDNMDRSELVLSAGLSFSLFKAIQQ